ncbi:FecR family protein [Denitratisoma oestradiolicum]|nr:FecR domain-containing protein [Denitratisoma oestradiolicum]
MNVIKDNFGNKTSPGINGKAQECFLALQDEDLSYEECQTWISWLDENPDHQVAYDKVAVLWETLGRIDPKSLRLDIEVEDSEVKAAQFSKVLSLDPVRRTTLTDVIRLLNLRAARRYVPVSFAVIVLFVMGIFHFNSGGLEGLTHQGEVFETKVAATRALALSDGTTVRLAGDTRIETDYSSKERRVNIVRGKAFFEVSKNADRPFIVHAASGEAKALGTKFEVNIMSQFIAVTVEEGLVQVLGTREIVDTASAGSLHKTIIGKGERVSYSKEGRLRLVEKVNLDNVLAWRNGSLVLNRQSLAEVIEEVNRYSLKQIQYRPDEIAGMTISGTIHLSQIDDWLKGLEKGYPLKVDAVSPNMVLITRQVLP